MKIEPSNKVQVIKPAVDGKPGDSFINTAKSGTLNPSQNVTNVTISATGKKLKTVQHTDDDETPFDTEKVETIKAAIKNGKLTVNSRVVAQEIINTAVHLSKSK